MKLRDRLFFWLFDRAEAPLGLSVMQMLVILLCTVAVYLGVGTWVG